ncbi:MAG: endonuclease/exonuclease/phosphatase family protein [Flavipsychrobacter sp.]|nr:endonuclease/exonuclease/phosphatase family protein [Flavipsychrobacter sp.]
MSQKLKIVTWNCNGKFREKYEEITKLDADLYIIQECENPLTTKNEGYKEWGQNHLWIGTNHHKGLGVFSPAGHSIELLDWDVTGLEYFIPFKFSNRRNFVAAWCHGAKMPTYSYIGQLWQFLLRHKGKLSDSIIAGDLNSNPIWDTRARNWNHSDVTRELREMGIVSAYHHIRNEVPGKELSPTFFLQKNLLKPYHIDYIFANESILSASDSTIEIGETETWIKISDHMPVKATLVI